MFLILPTTLSIAWEKDHRPHNATKSTINPNKKTTGKRGKVFIMQRAVGMLIKRVIGRESKSIAATCAEDKID